MNVTKVQVAGVAVAILGFVFAGAYAVASHHPDHPVQNARASARVAHVQAVDPSVPEASVVLKGRSDAPEEHPASF
jgi:hypothetical protein